MGAAPPGNEAPESLPVDGEDVADEVAEEAVEVPDHEASEDTRGDLEPEALEDDEEASGVEVEPTEEDRLRARIEELEAELTDRTVKLRAVSKAYTDLQEDLDAFRTRTAQQFAIMAERRAAEVVEKFFDPVQNLRRSLEAAEDDHGALIDGLKMILQQFIDSLQKLGLEQVPGVGSDFDPNVHEALAVTPVSEPGIDGKVLMVHNAGYMVKGIVIQAAQVIVGKYEAPPVAVEADDGVDSDDGADLPNEDDPSGEETDAPSEEGATDEA